MQVYGSFYMKDKKDFLASIKMYLKALLIALIIFIAYALSPAKPVGVSEFTPVEEGVVAAICIDSANAAEVTDDDSHEPGFLESIVSSVVDSVTKLFNDAINELFDKIKEWVAEMLNGLLSFLVDLINTVYGAISLDDINPGSINSLPFANIFAPFAYTAAQGLKGIGYAVLTIAFLVRLFNFGAHAESSGNLPLVKDVFMILITFAFFKVIIDNSEVILHAIYWISHNIANVVHTSGTLSVSLPATPSDDIGLILGQILLSIVVLIVSLVAVAIVWITIIIRTFQIFFYYALSPLSISFLFLDQTRQMGVGFLKNFAAVCLSAVVIMFAMAAAQGLINSGLSGTDGIFGLSAILGAGAMIVICVKSGAWAREVLGD